MATDPHAQLTAEQARERGCTCKYGCRNCGEPEARMGGCPAWDPCPLGREEDPECPVSATVAA